MSVEQRGLLRSTSFDVDDADSVERYRKHSNRSDEEWFGRRRWKIGPTWLRPRNILVGIAVCVGIVVVGAFWFRQPVDKPDLSSPAESSPAKSVLTESSPATSIPLKISPATFTSTELASIETPDAKKPDTNVRKFEKPKDFKIIGLVFFGRPSVVEILDCYLKKNLVSNGGFLDEVLWAINTRNEEDIKYLERLVKTTDGYKTIAIPNAPSYKDVWTKAVERNHMYIKIDDDMVSIDVSALILDD